jgi:hypothetical protein
MKTSALYLIAGILFPFAGQAIITTNNTMAGTNPSGINGFNWDYVIKFNGSSSVAVDPYWLLTAAHVADDFGNTSVTVNGQTYNQVGEIYNPTADLALIQLDRALPGYYSIYTGTYPTSSKNRLTGIMAGYGVTGTVVDQYNYTFNSTTGKGTERWGYNKIDGQLNYIGGIGKTNSGFQMYFNTADTGLESGAGTGDSGGGVFVQDAGIWKLAGIMADVSTDGSQDSVLAVDAQDYSSWITQTVPEPSTGILLVGVGLVLGAIRRLRYMYQ